jgi:hypothetical protein
MHRLSQHFSEPLLTLSDPSPPSAEAKAGEEDSGEPTTTYHLFPPPHILPAELETTLRELGFGYRAGFIESSLATLRAEFGAEPRDIEKGLETLRMTEVDVVRDKLLALKGVGRKVADCVMLMCLDQVSGIVPSKPSIQLSLDACPRALCSVLCFADPRKALAHPRRHPRRCYCGATSLVPFPVAQQAHEQAGVR